MTNSKSLRKAIRENRIATNSVIGTRFSVEASKTLVRLYHAANVETLQAIGRKNREYCKLVSEADFAL
jgi:hypothetical protein